MPAFEPDKKAVLEELAILRDELYRAERPIILDLIRRLQDAGSADDFMQLQLKLIGRAKARQQMADELREAQERLRNRLQALVKTDSKPMDEIKEVQRQLDLRKHQRRVSEALRWIVISIGDAMAWKLLGYDRAAITVLAQGERVARFADSAGFDAEVQVIEEQWRQGRLAIHSDLTTCLRHGDVTVFDPASGRVEIGEIRASKELGPEAPQLQRLEQATTLINTGHLERSGRPPLNLHRVPLPYRTHLAELRALIAKTRKEPFVAAKAGACLFIEVFRFDAGLTEDEIARRRARARTQLGWFDGKTNTFEWVWTVRRMRDRKHSFGGLAPLPLLPLDADDLVDLIMGWLDVTVTLNADCLAQAFLTKGLDVEIVVPPEHGEVFLRAKRRFDDWEITVQVSPQLREQMLNELMTPANVVGAVHHLTDILASRERQEGRGEEHVVALDDEARVWSRR